MSNLARERVRWWSPRDSGSNWETTASSNSTETLLPPFLRVPREIRDEIYKYLLHFPLPPLPGPAPFDRWEDGHRLERRPSQFEDPNRNIDILRVNKQIHDEAREVLYSMNVFLIQITTAIADNTGGNEYLYTGDLTALYDSPWETLGYFYGDESLGTFAPYTYWTFQNCPLRLKSYSYTPRNVCWCPKCVEKVADQDTFPIPALHYRPLIRRIRIDLFETSMAIAQLKPYKRAKARKLLLPFRYRLEAALRPAAPRVAVEIAVASLDPAIGVEFEIESEHTFTQLIETLWPLTTGPWKYKITLPDHIQRRYGHLTDTILEACSREVPITRAEEEHFKKVDIDRYRYLRVRNRGIYVLDHVDYFTVYGENASHYMHRCRCPKEENVVLTVDEPTSETAEQEPAVTPPASVASTPNTSTSRRTSRRWRGITDGTRKIKDIIQGITS
ncbi:hypothetical protein TWF718_009853 [Orbilia javanica]|uniref:Uncharacterized protein n=1 Tax=Orbilia javanica TaxID=47235 RepID=A0AAN8MT42_9PEZI